MVSRKQYKIIFVVGDSHKFDIINQFHHTLKEKILKYFIASETTRWVDVIDRIIKIITTQ